MKALHTKGPWTYREPRPEPFLVRDGDREWATFDWHIYGARGQFIGLIEFNTSNKGCPRVNLFKEARANMRLVVAAPDMREALKEAEIEIARNVHRSDRVLETVRYAIAKSGGES